MKSPKVERSEHPESQGRVLLSLARAALEQALGRPSGFEAARHPWLQEEGATFVTLRQEGKLRGCIGTLRANRPLIEDVRQNARAAAFEDPRFPPLTADELGATEIEVSLLTSLEPLEASSEEELVDRLRPRRDGVLLEYGSHRGTFLPQVWAQLPDSRSFLRHLKRKAGLAEDFWSTDVKIWRYGVDKWSEAETL